MRVKDPGSVAGFASGGGGGDGGTAGLVGGGGSGVMLWNMRVNSPGSDLAAGGGGGAGRLGFVSGYFAVGWVSAGSGFEAVPNSLSKSSSDSDDAGGDPAPLNCPVMGESEGMPNSGDGITGL